MHSLKITSESPDSQPRWRQLLAQCGLLDTVDKAILPIAAPVQTGQKTLRIQQYLSVLVEPNQVVELRALGVNGRKRVDSGYFNRLDALAKAASSYDGKAEGVYFTLNPVKAALLARANNRVKAYANQTTSDVDVEGFVHLPIDFDPVRPAGISSTDAEHQAALRRALACATWLTYEGWPEPIIADSGNGAHLLYMIDLPNDATSADLVKRDLEALAYLFSDEVVKVDASTSNPSRIFKLYGTLACKGDHTPERPHRRSAILSCPAQRQIVSLENLTALASVLPRSEPKPQTTPSRPVQGQSTSNGTAYAQAAFARELATLQSTASGNRNNHLFQTAAALFELVAAGALTSSEVWTALLDTAQGIGLSEAEARRTITSGEKAGLSKPRLIPPPREKLQASHTTFPQKLNIAQAVVSATTTSASDPAMSAASNRPSHLMHADALDTLPPIRWLIKDILPANNLVEVHGAPACGKTQVVFDMAQTLAATGKTVIYVAAEGLQGYRGRRRAWQKFHKTSSGELYIWDQAVQLFDPASVAVFLQEVKPKTPALIVFDTLSRCSLGADENNQKDMNFILDAMDRVRRETGATVIAVHHTNAAGLRERGSTVIRGGVDVMMEISRDDDLIVVSSSKMKDASDFEPIYLKPVLIDIGEERPVPVLIPAEKVVQTQVDKLTQLQVEILKAVGMEMFAESGIRSNQLDEILPLTTKRASKYHSLNTLIRLGYVKPHAKGDPYCITEAGRLKLSNATSSTSTAKSNMSKACPNNFLWTLPEACPMSNPVPHTCKCGTDETLDKQTNTDIQASNSTSQLIVGSEAITLLPVSDTESTTQLSGSSMSEAQIRKYADLAEVPYPTQSGAALFKICGMIPQSLREAFEIGLGNLVSIYYDELARQGKEPPEPTPELPLSTARFG